MLENVLVKRNATVKTKIAVKTIVSAVLIAMAIALPQIVHAVVGAPGGVKYLPMYLPVLIGGCLLGIGWGLPVAVLSPVFSYLITLAFGNPMPALARLPFMIAELSVMAVVTGIFSKKIADNSWMAFPAVLLAFVVGRAFFVALVAIFGSVAPFTVSVIWSQIQSGFVGLIAQSVIVPLVVMGLNACLKKSK